MSFHKLLMYKILILANLREGKPGEVVMQPQKLVLFTPDININVRRQKKKRKQGCYLTTLRKPTRVFSCGWNAFSTQVLRCLLRGWDEAIRRFIFSPHSSALELLIRSRSCWVEQVVLCMQSVWPTCYRGGSLMQTSWIKPQSFTAPRKHWPLQIHLHLSALDF